MLPSINYTFPQNKNYEWRLKHRKQYFIFGSKKEKIPQIEDWQNRPLDEVYPILYIDASYYSVHDNGMLRKLAAYVVIGIITEGKKF